MSINAKIEAESHAAKMDAIYGWQRHIYDATRAYYLLGRDRMLQNLTAKPGETVLEVGCGTGRNLVKAAQLYPEARFYGLDISREMLLSAARNLERSGLTGKVKLVAADATRFDAAAQFGVTQFDRVFYSYTLSMIPDWQGALQRGFAALKPGGSLCVADFGACTRLPHAFKSGLYAWLRQFHVTPRLELEDALAALIRDDGGTLEITRPYRGYAILARLTKTTG